MSLTLSVTTSERRTISIKVVSEATMTMAKTITKEINIITEIIGIIEITEVETAIDNMMTKMVVNIKERMATNSEEVIEIIEIEEAEIEIISNKIKLIRIQISANSTSTIPSSTRPSSKRKRLHMNLKSIYSLIAKKITRKTARIQSLK